MDNREKKTKRSIRNAFLKLRSKKPLEKIRVKELAELAEISKATFYLHYMDIYDLSEQLQNEVLKQVVSQISDPILFLEKPADAHNLLQDAASAHLDIIQVLFSGSQESMLVPTIEKELKQALYDIHPELSEDVKVDVTLSFLLTGGFYSYFQNCKKWPKDDVSFIVGSILKRFTTDC